MVLVQCMATSKVIIVLVESNEFPTIVQKVQHSHSRHQKTTSNLLRINLNGILKFNEIRPQEGAMYIINSMVEFSGTFYAIFSENDGLRQKDSQGF